MTSVRPICVLCSRLRGGDIGMRCDAYPNDIPTQIIRRDSLHLKPRKGDHGLQFELDEKMREAAEISVAAGLLPASILNRSPGR